MEMLCGGLLLVQWVLLSLWSHINRPAVFPQTDTLRALQESETNQKQKYFTKVWTGLVEDCWINTYMTNRTYFSINKQNKTYQYKSVCYHDVQKLGSISWISLNPAFEFSSEWLKYTLQLHVGCLLLNNSWLNWDLNDNDIWKWL